MTAGRRFPTPTPGADEPVDQSEIFIPKAKALQRLRCHDRERHGSSGLVGAAIKPRTAAAYSYHGSFVIDNVRCAVIGLDRSPIVPQC